MLPLHVYFCFNLLDLIVSVSVSDTAFRRSGPALVSSGRLARGLGASAVARARVGGHSALVLDRLELLAQVVDLCDELQVFLEDACSLLLLHRLVALDLLLESLHVVLQEFALVPLLAHDYLRRLIILVVGLRRVQVHHHFLQHFVVENYFGLIGLGCLQHPPLGFADTILELIRLR